MKPVTVALVNLLEKAIADVDRHVPTMDRAPTPDGGRVRATAVGILVAGRALVSAYSRMEEEFAALEADRKGQGPAPGAPPA